MFLLQAFLQPKEYNGIIIEDMECLFLKFLQKKEIFHTMEKSILKKTSKTAILKRD